MNNNLEIIRHSYAHVLAAAVNQLFDGAKFAIGPAIEYGFYYDFELPRSLQAEDLPVIEAKMRELINQNQPVEQCALPIAAAKEQFAGQPYKIELIEELAVSGATEVSIYNIAGFVDLCRGPHVERLAQLRPDAFLLERVSGAYWRGDSANIMLQRVYGVAFADKKQLKHHQLLLAEAAKRDHRNLGRELDLFSLSNDVGQGLALWQPKGAMIRFLLERFSQSAHIMNGYEWVYTPHIGRGELWETSGHLQFYKDSMYSPLNIDGEEYYLKPMNCPFHALIYKHSPKSYRDLPVRYAEFGNVYRYELSGALSGLTRVRGFTQDDAHIICTPEQIQDEVLRALQFSLYILKAFGLNDFKAYIATKPEKKFIGEDADWELAIESLKQAVITAGLEYEIDEGGGAFYGPKIDLKLNDAIGREWQCSTIQFDFNIPQRFDMSYVGADGQKHVPMMVHRALFGSVERFFAMLIEHYAGEFPLWLAPVQAGIVTVDERHNDYAVQVERELKRRGIRVAHDLDSKKMSAKIRRMELQKYPYIFVVGDEERHNNTIAVRKRKEGNLGVMTIDKFVESVAAELSAGQPQYLE